jgi:hypothetical protein
MRALTLCASLLATLPALAVSEPPPAVDARRTFARLAALDGRWEGRSTKGWENVLENSSIAKGSAILSTSTFKDAAHEGMATLFYLDGERLLLTHYCEAGNQPTLVASSAGSDGGSVTFTFLRGTGMRSRDDGHMDKVVVRFVDDAHFSSQWTWYQDGKERWLEEITYQRVP